jgi:hypothetical protein
VLSFKDSGSPLRRGARLAMRVLKGQLAWREWGDYLVSIVCLLTVQISLVICSMLNGSDTFKGYASLALVFLMLSDAVTECLG